jgi:hypothetical protein
MNSVNAGTSAAVLFESVGLIISLIFRLIQKKMYKIADYDSGKFIGGIYRRKTPLM